MAKRLRPARLVQRPLGADPRVRALAEGVRAMVRSLPGELQRAAAREVALAVRGWGEPDERTRMFPGEADDEADLAVEVLGQDARVRRATSEMAGTRWKALARCFHAHILKRLRLLEEKDFDSKASLDAAIAEVVFAAIDEVAKDPARWYARRCGRTKRAAPVAGAAREG